jgi:hypothetical protein
MKDGGIRFCGIATLLLEAGVAENAAIIPNIHVSKFRTPTTMSTSIVRTTRRSISAKQAAWTIAASYASQKNVPVRWLCCMKTAYSSCEEKHR